MSSDENDPLNGEGEDLITEQNVEIVNVPGANEDQEIDSNPGNLEGQDESG